MNSRILLILCLLLIEYSSSFAQKVLQLEKIGRIKTTKIYLGESIFLKTIQNPDIWFEAEIEDIIVDAAALVFYDRIIQIKDIVAIKRKKKSILHGTGRALQISPVVPVSYELIYGLIRPPIQWKSIGIFTGGSILLGSFLRLVPPKQYKMTKKYRLRALDLTFYPSDSKIIP